MNNKERGCLLCVKRPECSASMTGQSIASCGRRRSRPKTPGNQMAYPGEHAQGSPEQEDQARTQSAREPAY